MINIKRALLRFNKVKVCSLLIVHNNKALYNKLRVFPVLVVLAVARREKKRKRRNWGWDRKNREGG